MKMCLNLQVTLQLTLSFDSQRDVTELSCLISDVSEIN